MSHNLRHALKHFWLWRKNNVLGNLALAVACSVAMRFSPLKHELLNIILAGIPFFYILMGLSKDVFSWKYYQSLPLSKKELYHYHLLIQYPIYLPLLLWYFCFAEYTNDLFFEKNYFSWKLSLAIFLIYIFGTFLIGLGSFRQNYESVRRPFVKVDNQMALIQLLRNGIYGLSGLIILTGCAVYAGQYIPAFDTFMKWSAIAFAVALIPGLYIWFYYYNFTRWNREELSYFKNTFKVVRDVPLMAIGSAFILFTFQAVSVGTSVSGMYGKAGKKGIFKAIQTSNMEEFYRLKNDDKELRRVTDKGWTPLMVAAHAGNEAMFQALWDAGASRVGKVNAPDDAVHHDMDLFFLAVDGNNKVAMKKLLTPENVNALVGKRAPLHIAAFNCSAETIDLLLENGADPNVLNEGGSTALHVAARKNCFAGAVSLIEAGANPLIKNKKNEIAKDILNLKDKQFVYYLDKKGRVPAGK